MCFPLCQDSFCKAQQWLKDLERESPPGEVVVMLVGNKTDLGEQREVTLQVTLTVSFCSPRGEESDPKTHPHLSLRHLPTHTHTHTHTRHTCLNAHAQTHMLPA